MKSAVLVGGVTWARPVKMEAGSKSVLGALKIAFVTIGTMLFVIVSFRNTLMSNVAKIWSSSHDFWSYLWASVYRASGENDFIMAVICECPFKGGFSD